MVLTFHVPMLVVLVLRRVVGPVASKDFWLSSQNFMNLLEEEGLSFPIAEIS
jgi:hypothetical protein